jgi:hypothetical protein
MVGVGGLTETENVPLTVTWSVPVVVLPSESVTLTQYSVVVVSAGVV